MSGHLAPFFLSLRATFLTIIMGGLVEGQDTIAVHLSKLQHWPGTGLAKQGQLHGMWCLY